MHEALVGLGDVDREACDEIENVQGETSIATGAARIDANRSTIAIIGESGQDHRSPQEP